LKTIQLAVCHFFLHCVTKVLTNDCVYTDKVTSGKVHREARFNNKECTALQILNDALFYDTPSF